PASGCHQLHVPTEPSYLHQPEETPSDLRPGVSSGCRTAPVAALSRRVHSRPMSKTAKGMSPSLNADRELSVVQVDPTLGILIGIHPPGQSQGGWQMWIQPADLGAFA